MLFVVYFGLLTTIFRVCKVSSDWYRLSQHPPLLKQRKQYIKTLREEYQLSKENYPPPTLLENGTPQQQASFVPSRHMTVGQSPLNIIQPKSSHRNSNQRTNPPAPPTSGHTQSSLSPRGLGETPCPAYLLENVQKLSLDDGVAEVRRCLFPTAEISPTHIHRNLARPAWNQRNSYKCCTKGELMAGKKSNRCRLRRLWQKHALAVCVVSLSCSHSTTGSWSSSHYSTWHTPSTKYIHRESLFLYHFILLLYSQKVNWFSRQHTIMCVYIKFYTMCSDSGWGGCTQWRCASYSMNWWSLFSWFSSPSPWACQSDNLCFFPTLPI